MLAFSLMLLAILWTFQILFLENFYKAIKTLEIRADAVTIGGYVKEDRWDYLLEAVASRDDLYVEVWALNSGAVFEAGRYADAIQSRMTNREKAALFVEVVEKGGSIIRSYKATDNVMFHRRGSESILYANILTGENGKVWMIMLSANISPVNATINTLRYQIYVISAVMLLTTLFIALTLSRRITKPIVRLNSAAGELAKGNYDVEFRADGYQEIGQLADTLTNAARELGKTETLRQELIANVSHDLRTPLTLITGYSEMMRDIPGENTPENMQVIIDESIRLTSLVNDLLDLSKTQANMTEPDFKPFDLTACVREIIKRFARFTEQDDYVIRFEAEEDVNVLGDRSRISQVVYNLLANAVNYTGGDKTVTVRQQVDKNRVAIQIIDTGEGIAPENLPYIWDRYFKVDKVHKRAVTGTGLGLSIVKSILNQHRDVEYGVESTIGVGSSFWFSMRIVVNGEQVDPM